MRDEFFGHRDPVTGRESGDRDEWIEWDFALMIAMETIEAYTDQNGIFQWQKDDPGLEIYAQKKFDEYQADIDAITGRKGYEKKNGEYFVPAFKSLRPDKTEWTYADWREAEQKKIEKAREKGV